MSALVPQVTPPSLARSAPASALVFKNKNTTAIRVEVPELGKELSDGEYIGIDPEGTLYYNDANSFKPGKVRYKITAVTVTTQDGKESKATTTTHVRILPEDGGYLPG
ncbi:hypothetical protein B0H19DRAFT_1081159 [Mycena capillaripes]|nr:hypothetical protein B0H19DRAFT_1081159 [Mycena capillaripes]